MMTIIDLAVIFETVTRSPIKSPLREMIVVHPDSDFLDDMTGKLRRDFISFVLEELNVRSLVPCNDTLKYTSLGAEPDFSLLGKRLGKSMGVVVKEVKAMTQGNILAFEKAREVTIATHCLSWLILRCIILCLVLLFSIWVVREFKLPDGMTEKDVDAAGDGDILVILDLRPDESQFEASVAREVCCD
ncbi:hypothetical protein Pint_05423 [Pistacia integerrima]|uniref:Uncharacterized protein n=1 Tax=Pistacia integerrima TaxID=434235 RepID=A0ACC0Z5R3_9ROSI|nr:hypothetical protein Pint_05423 [Pistacia integerrima]